MVLLANRHGKTLHLLTDNWTSRPVSVGVRQTNSFDCGVWVLAGIAATLRGCHVTGLQESDMPAMRRFIMKLVLNLPTV